MGCTVGTIGSSQTKLSRKSNSPMLFWGKGGVFWVEYAGDVTVTGVLKESVRNPSGVVTYPEGESPGVEMSGEVVFAGRSVCNKSDSPSPKCSSNKGKSPPKKLLSRLVEPVASSRKRD